MGLEVDARLRARSRRIALAIGVVLLVTSVDLAAPPGSFPVVQAATSKQTPNHADPRSGTKSINHLKTSTAIAGTTPAPSPFMKNPTVSMQPAKFAITPTTETIFTSGDGHLTVDIPVGAISQTELTADGGATYILVRQVLPSSGSNAGGSGHFSFGTFVIQVVDAVGALSTHGLDLPLTLTYHYGSRLALDLGKAYMVSNAPIPSWVNLDPSSVVITGTANVTVKSATSSPGSSPSRGGVVVRAGEFANQIGADLTSVDPTAGTLTNSVPMSSPTTSVSWGTNSPIATFGKPDPFEVELSGGALTAQYPIDLPAGPKGQKPPLTLAYNSADVTDQHNPQGAASWVGEGWNLSLGSISWSEHNVQGGSGNPVWENSWQLNDPYGTSAELIPPSTNTSIYYDDTGNSWTACGNPTLWQTTPESHVKIYSYCSQNFPDGAVNAPCFRVFLTNGIKEEFGCTPDSLQWYPEASGANKNLPYIANWLLDLIIDSDGNQIRIHYNVDAGGLNGISYPRDVELASVQWDSPGCSDLNVMCGVYPNMQTWAPQMQVTFDSSHTVARLTGAACTGSGTPRCDDPIDMSSGGNLAAPEIQNTFVLNDLKVQICNSGCSSSPIWNTLRTYLFSYDQTGVSQIRDPITGLLESVAGHLDLTQMTIQGDDGATSLPTVNFGYTQETEYYIDSLQRPAANAGCGPSWNVPCNLWSQTYGGNSYYLTSVSNGIGLSQTFSWQNARDNMHGVNGGGTTNTQNPFYCNGGGVQNSWPCYDADDETWSRITLTQRQDSVVQLTQAGQGGTQTSVTVQSTWNYSYRLVYPLVAQECSSCVAGFSWGDQNDNDYLDFYNGKFMGFAQVGVGNPDGSVETHKFYSTEGWGLYDTSQVTCLENPPNPCHNDPWWDTNYVSQGVSNVLHGHEYEADFADTNGSTMLKQVLTTWGALCPPVSVAGSPPVGSMTWWGNLVSELDLGNPDATCDVNTFQVDTYTFDGSANSSHLTQAYIYNLYGGQTPDPYRRLGTETDTSSNGGANGSPITVVHTFGYIWNDAVSASTASATGYYLIDFRGFEDTEDSSAHQYQCTYYSYGGAHTLGQNSLQHYGDVTETDRYTTCGASPTGLIATKSGYGNAVPYGNPHWSTDPDTHFTPGCTSAGAQRSSCTTWDSTFGALATIQINALNQSAYTNYEGQPAPPGQPAEPAPDQNGGFGMWPISTTDLNGQNTVFQYDPLGRVISVALPAEPTGWTTQTMSYTVWCTGTAAQTPCVEVDQTQRLDYVHNPITYRAFYDGLGRLVETRSPSTVNYDIVRYYLYYASENPKFESVPYLVAAYTGSPGAAAYSIPDTTVAGTCNGSGSGCSSYGYDGLGRTISVTDPLTELTASAYSIVCNAPGTGDSACYEQTMTTDPLGHESASLVDSMGRTNYEQRYTGNSNLNYALYATTKYTFDYVGDLTKILHPDRVTSTTFTYDMAGRQTGMTDPDRGKECYVYDADGNLTQSTDARSWNSTCSVGSVFVGYDALDRPIWRNTTNSPTGAYDTYTYDSTANGNFGVGRLTGETFAGSAGSGSYSFVYDARGRSISTTLSVTPTGGTLTNYPITGMTYDDADSLVTETYPDGETVTNTYGSVGDRLIGVNTQVGSTVTTLMSTATYQGTGGAYGFISSANLANSVYGYSATYDLLGRASDLKVTRTSGGATLFEQSRTFDAGGNVHIADTNLNGGTDNQAFCYDEQNRLVAAASDGLALSCGGVGSGSLRGAYYDSTFGYDNMGRLTSAPLGTYTYGSSAHVHAATAIGTTYTAAYDLAGNMTCRAPSNSATCSGTQTGAQLTYNNEGQLSNWQNQPSNPTSTAAYLYDAQGNRVAQQTVSGGTTTTTVYVGNLEEDSTSGGTTTKTTYYYANGMRFAVGVNGTFYYLASDGLGSADETLDSNGNVVASILYAPYGSARYTSGTMPTDHGFTGQIADSTSGLDYYGARYYDPVGGQFVSADSVVPGGGYDIWGLSRYAYVEGNPVDRTDPIGHCQSDSCYEAADAYGISTASSADAIEYQQERNKESTDAPSGQSASGSGSSNTSNGHGGLPQNPCAKSPLSCMSCGVRCAMIPSVTPHDDDVVEWQGNNVPTIVFGACGPLACVSGSLATASSGGRTIGRSGGAAALAALLLALFAGKLPPMIGPDGKPWQPDQQKGTPGTSQPPPIDPIPPGNDVPPKDKLAAILWAIGQALRRIHFPNS